MKRQLVDLAVPHIFTCARGHVVAVSGNLDPERQRALFERVHRLCARKPIPPKRRV